MPILEEVTERLSKIFDSPEWAKEIFKERESEPTYSGREVLLTPTLETGTLKAAFQHKMKGSRIILTGDAI